MIALGIAVGFAAFVLGAQFSSDALVIALSIGLLSDSIRSNRMAAKDVLVEDIKARINREPRP